jgi:polysaccharide export outer membrane protein
MSVVARVVGPWHSGRQMTSAHVSSRSGRALMVAIALAASTVACRSLGEYTWVNDYRDPHPPSTPRAYVLGPGDIISVRVYNQEGMSARGKIRTDGKISLPFLNDVQAEGYTPPVLAEQLEARLKDYVNKPVVTISVDEQRVLAIAVVGDVAHQGMITLAPDAGVLQALATAGGLTELAHDDGIFVVRYEPKPIRIRFSYKELQHAVSPASAFRLREGDQIVVE